MDVYSSTMFPIKISGKRTLFQARALYLFTKLSVLYEYVFESLVSERITVSHCRFIY